MADKIGDLESRSRRCNLRVVGIPERLEGADPVSFMSGFFPEVLCDSFAPSPMKLDRAHRLGPHPTPGSAAKSGPRVMIVKFHNFRDKEAILRRPAREQLHFRGKKIHIFPDFTSVVAKKRAAFVDVKRILHEKKIRFSLRFPAILHVNHSGENLRFASS
ncbi:hypothetical protein DPEC_G00207190 [Dallia pectoralis]|uniref:Uncharacterized protein n=1 Tax=Dallia pectoralis TaxID=75939 RepID=A0ACC2G500_DALPE|nr:hypothetical protein DPEC_G00207190 [Dallia pectoralis]